MGNTVFLLLFAALIFSLNLFAAQAWRLVSNKEATQKPKHVTQCGSKGKNNIRGIGDAHNRKSK